MRIMLVHSPKGGSGKTTISRELAVAATLAGRRAALIDLDPQGTLTGWFGRRQAETPHLLSAPVGHNLSALRDAGLDELLIDTPPGQPSFLADLVRQADAVLVPVRPSPDDLLAAATVAEDLAVAGHPAWAYVLTQTPARSRLADGALRQLAGLGRVAPVSLGFRADYPTAAVSGTAGVEYLGTKAEAEVTQLRTYVDSLCETRMGKRNAKAKG